MTKATYSLLEEVAFVWKANKLLHAGTGFNLGPGPALALGLGGGKGGGADGQGDEGGDGDDHGLFHGDSPSVWD